MAIWKSLAVVLVCSGVLCCFLIIQAGPKLLPFVFPGLKTVKNREDSLTAELNAVKLQLKDSESRCSKLLLENKALNNTIQSQERVISECETTLANNMTAANQEIDALKNKIQAQALALNDTQERLETMMNSTEVYREIGRLEEQVKAQRLQLNATNERLNAAMVNNTAAYQEIYILKNQLQAQILKLNDTQMRLSAAIMNSTAAYEKISVLENRLEKWGITMDPPTSSQEPIPDYNTTDSKAAFNKFGLYSDQDNEMLLVKSGPVFYSNGVYIGQFNRRNQQHGYGKFLYTSGNTYEGEWRNGWQTGRGRLINKSGDVYVGEFVQDKREGFGIKYYSGGSVYSGGWSNDSWNGVGSLKVGATPQETVYYREIGDFANDQLNGTAAFVWTGGESMYVGSYKGGRKHGKGLSGLPDGSMYFGTYVDNLKSGTGRFFYSTGEVYQGNWERDRKNGPGRLTYPGRFDEGVWVDDVLQ